MSHSSFKKGFTLIELLVSIGIIVIILGVVILNQTTYAEAAALRNLTDEIASTVSQAQAYGIAVKEFGTGSEDFSNAYGLSVSILEDSFKTSYLFFADLDNDELYDGDWDCETGAAEECLEEVPILRGNYVDSLCIIRSVMADECMSPKRADISFLRPNLSARITVFNNGGQTYDPANMIGVKFVLKSPAGLTRWVAIYESGQISVQ